MPQTDHSPSPASSQASSRVVTVFGGSGFLGRHVVRALAKRGWRVRVAVRRPNEALFLKTAGAVGQVAIMQANIRDEESVRKAVQGVDAVINLVGILYESGKQKFTSVQAGGARIAAQAAAAQGVAKFVHLSAIGASPESESAYARSKAAGEAAVTGAMPKAVILRPSIVIGPEDGFFNRFAKMAVLSPVLPLIGGGETLYQPVAVQDVAQAVCAALEDAGCGGKVFELGGPEIFSFRGLMELMLAHTGQKRLLLPLPFPAARLLSCLTQFLPAPPLTPDQVKLLKSDNVANGALPGLGELGVTPTPIGSALPQYLSRFRTH